jgi:P27 family predicted phage terminase small subunit
MAGRRPKPTQLQLLHGAFDKNPQRRNRNEPIAPTEAPICPNHLNAVAKAEWKKICGQLRELGILSRSDRAALELYCQSYAAWREALKMLEQHGCVVETQRGPRRSPWDVIREKSGAFCTRLLIEFGLTPAARTRVHVQNPKMQGVISRKR